MLSQQPLELLRAWWREETAAQPAMVAGLYNSRAGWTKVRS